MPSITWSFSTTATDSWNEGNGGYSYTLYSQYTLPSNASISSVVCSVTLHASRYNTSNIWRIYYIDVSNGPTYGSTGGSIAYTEGMTGIDTTISGLTMTGSSYYAFNNSSITVYARANNNKSDSKTWIRGISVTVNYTVPSTTGSTVSLSKSSAQLGDSITAYISREVSSNFHTVVWSFNGTTVETQYNVGVGSSSLVVSTSYTISTNLLPSSQSGTLTCKISTYNSSNQYIGSDTKSIIVTVPESYVPTISLSVSLNNQLTISGTNYNVLSYTNPVATVTISAGSGSTISNCVVSCTGLASQSRSSSGSVTFDKFTTSGSNIISATVTDARGRTATASTSVDVYSYNNPSMSYSCFRCISDGTASPSGTYAKISVSYTPGTLDSTGLTSVTVPVSSILVKSKLPTDQSYGNPSGSILPSSQPPYQGYVILGTYNAASQYSIQIVLTDPFVSTTAIDELYAHSDKIVDFYHSSTKDLIGFGADVQSTQVNYNSGIVVGNDWRIYNSNGLIVGVGSTSDYMIVYSSSQPANGITGQIWIKPVT